MVSPDEAKSTIKPLFDDCIKRREEHDFETAVAYFDPDAVFIQKGNRMIYGREQLKEEHDAFKEKSGKRTTKITNETYEMDGDFGIVHADYEIETEKIGVLKGKLLQIWRKSNDKWLVIHEEYLMDLKL
ncbi:unnamed protein product [Cylicocyclus nassatus]|uniref:DUF4440 domain-containing protein n=1 Tax=Cylicocyclus nassatus TaxID=53992 RepID=A0AA36H5U5_CYLNA|nr:unnamed protein product [Cylicocyclus nassatus]